MNFRDDRDGRQGCAPTPGMIIGVVLVLLWMRFVVPAYMSWRYGDEEPQEVPRQAAPEGEKAPQPSAGEERETPSAEDAGLAAGEGLLPGQETAEALAERAAKLPEPPVVGPVKEPVKKPEELELEVRRIEVETDELLVEFSTLGASIERAYLLNYHSTPKDTEPLPILMPLRGTGGEANSFVLRPVVDMEGKTRGVDLSKVVWKLEGDPGGFDENDESTVSFTTTRAGVRYRKRFILHREGHVLELEIEAENTGSEAGTLEFDLVGPNGIVPDDVAGGRKYIGMLAVLAARTAPAESLKTDTVGFKDASKSDLTERGVSMALNEWVAVKNRYFAALCQAEDPSSVRAIYAEAVVPDRSFALDRLLGQQNVAGVMRVSFGNLEQGASDVVRLQAYLGPMHGEILRAAGGERGWEDLVDFGWFGWLSKLLLGLLNALHLFTGLFGRIIGGYGFAILLLTLAVKGGMFPIMRKSMTSMHKMQKLAPEVAAIKKRYESDKSAESQRKMQMEIMAMYKEHNVSMLGGCLPMFIQLPMFIALYGMLRTAFELRHEPYLWISDLTQSENLVSFGVTIPVIGWTALNLLPFAYLGLTLLQQHLQPKAADPQAAQQQKMMKFMMIFIFFLFYNMPSGLVLYFVFSNGLGILEQWIIRSRLDTDAAPVAAAGDASVDGRLVGAGKGRDAKRETAWDKEDARDARKAEKRRKKKQERKRLDGPGK